MRMREPRIRTNSLIRDTYTNNSSEQKHQNGRWHALIAFEVLSGGMLSPPLLSSPSTELNVNNEIQQTITKTSIIRDKT